MTAPTLSASALDSRVRRAARRAGFVASKSRSRTYHHNAQGGYQLCDGTTGAVLQGLNYELTATQVIEFCAEQPASTWRDGPAARSHEGAAAVGAGQVNPGVDGGPGSSWTPGSRSHTLPSPAGPA